MFIKKIFNPIENGLFQGCPTDGEVGKKASLPKICHIYPTMVKLGTVIPYLKKLQKLYESHDTPQAFFLLEISKFCYINKYRYRFI